MGRLKAGTARVAGMRADLHALVYKQRQKRAGEGGWVERSIRLHLSASVTSMSEIRMRQNVVHGFRHRAAAVRLQNGSSRTSREDGVPRVLVCG